MNKAEYLQYYRDCQAKALAITEAKNADYTGDSDNPFFNFELAEHLGVVDSDKGVFVRMCDKVNRVATFLKGGILKVKDESVEDTLLDLSNYCIILAAKIREKRLQNTPPTVQCVDERTGRVETFKMPMSPVSESGRAWLKDFEESCNV